jgi:phosphoribosyl-ATP pyrophosphohydrolase
MATQTQRSGDAGDAIRALEADLKRVADDPARFPRTLKLRAAGTAQHAKKMVEEAAELAIEAVRGDRQAALYETADLVYNLVVLLEGLNLNFDDIGRELERRRAAFGIAAKQQKNGETRLLSEPDDAI